MKKSRKKKTMDDLCYERTLLSKLCDESNTPILKSFMLGNKSCYVNLVFVVSRKNMYHLLFSTVTTVVFKGMVEILLRLSFVPVRFLSGPTIAAL